MKINHFGNLQNLKIAVVSSLAIGSVATICATPAQAAVLTGGVSFNDGALNVIGTIPATPGPGSFIAGFNIDTPLPKGEGILLSTTYLAHAGLHQRK